MGNQFSFVSTARNYDIPRISIGNSTVGPREIASTSQPTGSTASQTSSLTLSAIAQSGMSQFLGLISVDGKNPWILDSEATNHLIGFSEHFVSYTPYAGNEKIWIADGFLALIVGKGQIVLLTISRELHYKATFLPESICFEDLSLGRTIDTVRHSRELYILDDDTSGSSISRLVYCLPILALLNMTLYVSSLSYGVCIRAKQHQGESVSEESNSTYEFIEPCTNNTVSENDRSDVLLENVEEKDNGHELVGCKWLFTLKYKADGTLDKNKTRSSRGGLHEPPPGLKPSLVSRKSTSDYCTFVWGNLVTWRSKKQSVVTRSSVEAEYRAMSLGICEEIWLQKVLSDLHQECETLLKLFCDNKAAISIANNPIQHDRTKHVEIDRHFIKERLDNKAYAFRPFESTSC
ncbi:Copia protein [Cucumis melo var. makuwa]|uniref:Copia protein n=1 Tax=Cucumis melo var. makuwa TaxID=1194695 RepID=A0A5D3BMY8_CUCMM|nr:Copia protein [Cucumis melo var. makuwa]